MTVRGARYAAALLVGAGVAASAPAASAAPVPLIGTQWRFESSGVARTAPVKYTGSPAYFSIDGTRGGGNDGCNVFGMNVEVKGDRATFSGLFSTLRMCYVPGAGVQFGKAFAGPRTVTVTGNRLRVSDGPRGYWNFVANGPAKK
ncbi:META domain (plasmid) [Tsukamurella tyrosinosolvens]|uniref:Heat shock protein HslJ n=1 Tax=Tsukamurella tyrosinosolvens TaxID=57704 RepID=A0A1H4Z325_TSUTY|nr:META domain-containing protein [Tsukamurella tyrosinosolvens]MEC4611886.1 META domain-containing protein [Tsukamurella tyrosinosolvens]SED23751.1 Heat shock protein HslJ [Tsukamurella tyrosinosolvens]VEH91255.1 META domain [Tsukamurella tyrosinosolvens]